jgi:squalene-associated FAD-dependent desaturase
MSEDRVVVVGGGLAGITAALLLAEAGLPVTVLEERPWLGGATWSFGRRGLTIDNGQHVFLRCFTAYRELLARLAAADSVYVQDRLDVTVLAGDGQVRLRRSNWPAPTHLATMLARYRPLTPSQRLGVLPAAIGMWLSDLSAEGSDGASIGDWLSRHGQDEQAISKFWEMFLMPFLNASAAEADLGTAAALINAALLSRRDQADLGVAAVPLRDLHAGPAARLLAELGVELRLGAKVTGIRREAKGGYLVQLAASSAPAAEAPGQRVLDAELPAAVTAAGVVLAVPAWAAGALVPAELSPKTRGWGRLKPSPIVSVHVIYDTPVTRVPFATAIGSPIRWIVDKTRPAGLHTGQYLAASIPAAGHFVDEPPAALRAQLLPELERLFPAAAAAKVEDFFVTRERCATFLPAPGSRALRPGQVTGLPGFALAGAWTDTGWPDTMEGAVRSGRLAGEAILRVLAVEARAPGRAMPAAAVPVLAAAAPPEPLGPVEPVKSFEPVEASVPAEAVAEAPGLPGSAEGQGQPGGAGDQAAEPERQAAPASDLVTDEGGAPDKGQTPNVGQAKDHASEPAETAKSAAVAVSAAAGPEAAVALEVAAGLAEAGASAAAEAAAAREGARASEVATRPGEAGASAAAEAAAAPEAARASEVAAGPREASAAAAAVALEVAAELAEAGVSAAAAAEDAAVPKEAAAPKEAAGPAEAEVSGAPAEAAPAVPAATGDVLLPGSADAAPPGPDATAVSPDPAAVPTPAPAADSVLSGPEPAKPNPADPAPAFGEPAGHVPGQSARKSGGQIPSPRAAKRAARRLANQLPTSGPEADPADPPGDRSESAARS